MADQPPAEFHWKMSDPDADGNVWLQWTDEGGSSNLLMLGAQAAVAECMADWLGRIDFGN
ncbi:MAG: hypothetical protein E6G92_07150 [Alphaproteobacteria bacterium]|nr:MAG: hypothetical protein E6G92_07150 [Alphaproteobacteria bacterium]